MPAAHDPGVRSLGREYDDRSLPVSGELPGWLSGTLLRNGPGLFEVGGRELNHWFDGLALLRRWAVRDGEVRFGARFLRSEEYAHVRERGTLKRGQFGTAVDRSLGDRLRDLVAPALSDNASIGFQRVAGHVLAVTETPRGVAVDPTTLETLGTVRLDDGLDVLGTLGHAHYDPEVGAQVNLGVDYGRESRYVLFRRRDGRFRAEPVGAVSVDRPAYVHSFALTPNYAVVTEPPLRANPLSLVRDRPFVENFRWRDRPTQFQVIDRASGDRVATARAAPCFVYHHVNAVERGDELAVDLVAFPGKHALEGLTLRNLRRERPDLPAGEFRRYRLPLAGGWAAAETLHPGPLEFPMINYPRYAGREYRYAYFAGNRDPDPATLQDRLLKVDLRERTAAVWEEPGAFPGEPVFVPRREGPDADTERRNESDGSGSDRGSGEGTAEDDGVVLSVVLDADAGETFLLVLDAATFEERARATLPAPLPFGFHGQFYADEHPRPRTMP